MSSVVIDFDTQITLIQEETISSVHSRYHGLPKKYKSLVPIFKILQALHKQQNLSFPPTMYTHDATQAHHSNKAARPGSLGGPRKATALRRSGFVCSHSHTKFIMMDKSFFQIFFWNKERVKQ
jgi:hypothetical protein